MNNFPRIKELKIQACKWASENASSAEYENAADQKFAELIIKDCMWVCLMQRDPITLNYKTSERYVEQIAKFFGVEE